MKRRVRILRRSHLDLLEIQQYVVRDDAPRADLLIDALVFRLASVVSSRGSQRPEDVCAEAGLSAARSTGAISDSPRADISARADGSTRCLRHSLLALAQTLVF